MLKKKKGLSEVKHSRNGQSCSQFEKKIQKGKLDSNTGIAKILMCGISIQGNYRYISWCFREVRWHHQKVYIQFFSLYLKRKLV